MGKLIAMIPIEPGLISYLPHVGHFEQSGPAIILNESELVVSLSELIQCTEHIELRNTVEEVARNELETVFNFLRNVGG